MRNASAACVLLALLCGCGSDDAGEETQPPDPKSLHARGKYAVGYRELTVTYQPKGVSESRTLEVELWYPALDGGEAIVEYQVAGVVAVPSNDVLTAPALIDGAEFPVAVYSHGNAGVGLVGYPYAELMASWGWIVVAPDHTGNTVLDQSNPFALDLLVRPQDVYAVAEWVETGATFPFPGKAAAQRLLIGHSFGAYTVQAAAGAKIDVERLKTSCAAADDGSCELVNNAAWQQAATEGATGPRFDAIVPQAPGSPEVFIAGTQAAIEQPAMVMTGRLDKTTTWEAAGKPTWEALAGADDVWVDLEAAGHYSFLTVCGDAPDALLESLGAEEDGCGPEFIPYTEAVPTLVAYTLAFGKAHVLGETEWKPVIEGPAFAPGFAVTAR